MKKIKLKIIKKSNVEIKKWSAKVKNIIIII